MLQATRNTIIMRFNDPIKPTKETNLGFGVWGLGVGVWGLGFGDCGLEFGDLRYGVSEFGAEHITSKLLTCDEGITSTLLGKSCAHA